MRSMRTCSAGWIRHSTYRSRRRCHKETRVVIARSPTTSGCPSYWCCRPACLPCHTRSGGCSVHAPASTWPRSWERRVHRRNRPVLMSDRKCSGLLQHCQCQGRGLEFSSRTVWIHGSWQRHFSPQPKHNHKYPISTTPEPSYGLWSTLEWPVSFSQSNPSTPPNKYNPSNVVTVLCFNDVLHNCSVLAWLNSFHWETVWPLLCLWTFALFLCVIRYYAVLKCVPDSFHSALIHTNHRFVCKNMYVKHVCKNQCKNIGFGI